MTTSPIVSLSKSQIQLAGELIARAFFDDPLSIYIWQNPAARLKPLIKQSVSTVRYGVMYGETFTTTDVSGLVIWLKSSADEFNVWRSIRSGLIFSPFFYGRDGLKRIMHVVNYSAEMHKKVIQEPHWYLMQIGVEPAKQRRGVGKSLLEPMLARADKEQRACYLEMMEEKMLIFYQSFGFKVVAEGASPAGGPKIWFMVRRPQ
ncbi:MAG: GNAT family N-acetyltransferase [Methylococcaceae bacterium]|nr:GNAT family N-acetyltransferase [Methylococcaceae bacterium]